MRMFTVVVGDGFLSPDEKEADKWEKERIMPSSSSEFARRQANSSSSRGISQAIEPASLTFNVSPE